MKIDVIPAMDLIDGQCVRLVRGDYQQQTTYAHDPVELARQFAAVGISRLHLVDLEGAKAGRPCNLPVLEKIARATDLKVDFGGGIKTSAQVEAVLAAGAAQVSIGSMAVKQRETFLEWIAAFGAERFILCADLKGGKVATAAWQEGSDLSASDFIQSYQKYGIKHVLCTVVERDGTLEGVGLDVYQAIMQEFPDLYLIASGGVAGMADLTNLAAAGIPAVVVGKAFYEGRISIEDLAKFYVK